MNGKWQNKKVVTFFWVNNYYFLPVMESTNWWLGHNDNWQIWSRQSPNEKTGSSLKGKTTSSWKPDSWQGSGTIVSCQGFVSPKRKPWKKFFYLNYTFKFSEIIHHTFQCAIVSRNGDRKNLQSKKKEKKNAGYPETQLKKIKWVSVSKSCKPYFFVEPFQIWIWIC